MNVFGRIFLNYCKERRKDEVFFVRCRITYVLKKYMYMNLLFAGLNRINNGSHERLQTDVFGHRQSNKTILEIL